MSRCSSIGANSSGRCRTIVACLEEPIASSSIVPMYFVCRRARAGREGRADRAGARRAVRRLQAPPRCPLRRRRWRRLPSAGAPGDWLGGQPAAAQRDGEARRLRARHRGSARAISSTSSRSRRRSGSTALFRGGPPPKASMRGSSPGRQLLPQMEHLDELGGFQHLEIRSSLPDELLMFADKLSMAHGLEVRVPYLDRTVVEFAERLRASMKIRGRRASGCTGRCASGSCRPAPERARSAGFAVNVVDQWFQSSTNSTLSELLLDRGSLMFDLLEPEPVRALLEEHRSGQDDNHKLLFSLAMFEQWLRGRSRRRPDRTAPRAAPCRLTTMPTMIDHHPHTCLRKTRCIKGKPVQIRVRRDRRPDVFRQCAACSPSSQLEDEWFEEVR